jgi:hypothetical protein
VTRGDSIRLMHPLFQEGEGGSTPTSPLSMRVERIAYETAKALNQKWHSRLPRIGDPPGTTNAMICFGAAYRGVLYAVAIWSHPVNRSLPQNEWLELRRMAISDDAPKMTGSWMLGVMARLVRKSRPEVRTLISYQDKAVHSGTIYRAAGWKATTVKRYSSWSNQTRVRPECQAKSDKQRWEYILPQPESEGAR